MKSWELLKLSFQAVGCKNIAQSLNVSLSLVHRWSAPCEHGCGFTNPLDRIAQIQRFTGDRRLAQWVCQRGNGYYVPNPPVRPMTPAEHLAATGAVIVQLGTLQTVLAGNLKPQPISLAETETMRRLWEDIKTDMEGYVTRCEAGVVRRLPVQLFWLLGWWFTGGTLPEMMEA